MRPNTVKRQWAAGEPSFGAWLGTCSPLAAESMAHQGWDWLVVDGEHSPVDLQTMIQMFQAISTTDTIPIGSGAMERPGDHQTDPRRRRVRCRHSLGQQPRRGGAGRRCLPVPRPTDCAASARTEASSTAAPNYGDEANNEIACIIQIETIEAVERIDEILSVPGIDATCIGPADLAKSMGIPVRPDNPHPDHIAACAEVLAASQRIDNRVAPGIFTSGPVEAKRRAEEGWLYIPSGSDGQFMAQASAQGLAHRS